MLVSNAQLILVNKRVFSKNCANKIVDVIIYDENFSYSVSSLQKTFDKAPQE